MPQKPSDYGQKEKGYVQPFDDYLNDMLTYIDTYACDEPSTQQRREMMKDAQVKSVVELLKEAVVSTGWELHYDWDEDKELGTEMVNYLYDSLNRINETPWNAGGLDDLLEKWMDALWFKKMACELVYAHDKAKEYIYVKKAKVLPPESIRLPIDRHGNLEAIIQYPYNIEVCNPDGSDFGEKMPPNSVKIDMEKCLLWINGDDYGQYEGKSDLDCVYKYWFLKDFILKYWSMFVERFGAPVLVSFVKAKNMKAARDALKTILTDTSYSMEQEDKVEMLEPKKEGKVFESMITYCDNNITKGLIVPTLLLGTEAEGSKALGDVHFKLFEYRVTYIQRKLQNLARALIKKEINLNFDGVKHYPVFTFKPFSINNRVKMAQTFDLLVKNALVHPNEPWVRKELQLPEAEEGYQEALDEAWKAKMVAGSGQTIGGQPSPAADITRTEAQTKQREPADVGETTQLADENLQTVKEQFERSEGDFRRMLLPITQKGIEGLVAYVEEKLKNDTSIEFAATPSWLTNLQYEFGFNSAFAEVYDEVMVNVILEDNAKLTNLGMTSAFDVQTRTGAFNYIDSKMADIRSGLLDYGSAAANELELRILEDTKLIIQAGLDEGLRGRDVTKNLQDTLLGKRYNPAQLETVVRTNTTAIVNQGKKAFGRANSDFVKGFQFHAVLDLRTTDICEQRDGKVFALNDPALDYNTPPLHFSCRSILDYIISGSPTFNPAGIDTSVPEGFGDGIYAMG